MYHPCENILLQSSPCRDIILCVMCGVPINLFWMEWGNTHKCTCTVTVDSMKCQIIV